MVWLHAARGTCGALRPACRFPHGAVDIERIETGIGISLQQAVELHVDKTDAGFQARQAMPSSRIDSCASVNATEPWLACGQVTATALKPLGRQAQAIAAQA
jgi:hypothetical protein